MDDYLASLSRVKSLNPGPSPKSRPGDHSQPLTVLIFSSTTVCIEKEMIVQHWGEGLQKPSELVEKFMWMSVHPLSHFAERQIGTAHLIRLERQGHLEIDARLRRNIP